MMDARDLFEGLPAAAAEQCADDAGRWPAQLAEMTDILQDELAQALPDLPPRLIRQAACRQMCRLAVEFGGTNTYIPKGDAIARVLRNLALWGEFDGTVDGPRGVRALARQHGLSEISVWRVLSEQRRRHRARVQGALPL